ncbi:MAG: hypothetical protein F6J97_20845 [Leptolyngbya sp. SIO4C1]|nr:hypothetical protein [Leptolyngbya sp. SIO4C1]
MRPRCRLIGLSALLSIALFPASAIAASFAFGERAVIGLYRGAGNLLGPLSEGFGGSGVDQLERKIQAAFPSYHLSTQTFESYAGNVFDFREVGGRDRRRAEPAAHQPTRGGGRAASVLFRYR